MNKSLQQSIKALTSNPARTVLTTTGIVIGIATVVMVLSAGAGFKSLINSQIQSLGNNTLFIKTRVPPTTKQRAGALTPGVAVGVTTFTQQDLDDIKMLNNVVNDYGMVTGLAVASYGDNAKSVIYYGASASRFSIDQSKLAEGRFYTQAEDDGADQVLVLGSTLATDLFGQSDALGKLVRVGNLNFEVIGVYQPQGALAGTDDSLFMPMGTAQKKMLGINYIDVGVVQMQNTNLADATAAEVTTLLEHNHHITDSSKDDFTVATQAQVLDIYNTIFNGVTALLVAIAAISLVVGGVGIMNIMYVVVTERTAEIGLKKALGAKNSDILKEFLTESVMVTVLGGVIGILLGSLLGWLISLIAVHAGLAWTFSVPWYGIVLAVGVSGAIGIFFGVFPARSASKLDPIVALGYE